MKMWGEKVKENRQLHMDFQSFMVKNRNWHWHMWFVCWSVCARCTHKRTLRVLCENALILFGGECFSIMYTACTHTRVLFSLASPCCRSFIPHARFLSYFAFVFKISKHVQIEQFVGILNGFFVATHTYMNASHYQAIFNGACIRTC